MEALLQQLIADAVHIDAARVHLTRPDATFGDYACTIALQLAGERGESPRDMAQEIATILAQDAMVHEATVAGPGFINIRLAATTLYSHLQDTWSDTYGNNADGAGKTVVVEYPSPNMAKPYSVGHLRPGNQGWAIRQLMEATGWQVITDNHLGDYGAPFGIWVVGFLRHSSEAALQANGVYELGRVYIHMKQELKQEAERGEHQLADEVQAWLLRLESGDEQAAAYSKQFNEISLQHIHTVMQRLKITTDYELGEAFFVPQGKAAVTRLVDEGVAVQNEDGSVIVPLQDAGFDVPLLVQKSNGAALYATTDLATILYREENWHPDRVIYCVGAEQQFYFAQLFAMAKKLGITTELIHVWFGVIDQKNQDGTREKMSSRKGVILMEELLDTAEQKATELVGERTVSEGDIQKIALGAVKFTDFVADRRTNILFDWETIFALTGMSGPYVQYAAVRVNALLVAHDTTDAGTGTYAYEAEKQLILKLLDYPGVVRQAADKLEPHKIANYAYELARELNRYYEATRVSDAEETVRNARLELLRKVSGVLTHALALLGIEVPQKM